jgi:hypothetical protein
MVARSFTCLALIPVFWFLSVVASKGRGPGGSIADTRDFVLSGVAWALLLTWPGAFFARKALEIAPGDGRAILAFALNLVVFLVSIALFVLCIP